MQNSSSQSITAGQEDGLPISSQQVGVWIGAFLRFQTFHIAHELARAGAQVIMCSSDIRKPRSHPRLRLERSNPVLRYLPHVFARLGRPKYKQYCINHFRKWMSRKLSKAISCQEVNVFHGWASFSRESLNICRARGIPSFLERSCPHVLFQRDLLYEEAPLYGLRPEEVFAGSTEGIELMLEEYELADYITTCSSYSASSFIARGFPQERIIKITLGANFTPVPVQREPTGTFRLFCVATAVVRKGLYYLLEAWKKLGLKNAELVLRSTLPNKLRHYLKDESIIVLPRLSVSELIEEYRKSSAFCLPSVDDGFGMVVLEALSCGLPTVVSDHVGASELITHGSDGLVIPARNIDSLAEQILFLYENREAALVMGEKGQEIASNYTWERYAEELLSYYFAGLANPTGKVTS